MWSWETLRDFFGVPIYHLDETGRKVPLIGKAEVARQLLEARVRTKAVPDGVEILRAVEKHHPLFSLPQASCITVRNTVS